jgi:predicted nucleotidyltransferase component of viral defense system
MINKQNLLQITKKYQTNERNVINEYFQHIFLKYFYQNKKSSSIYFKGGTALRIIFGSPRFSEDLDFSSKKVNQKEIEDLLISTLDLITKEGITAELIEAKKTSGGYLGIIKFNTNEYSSRLMFEISQRKSGLSGEVNTVASDFTIPYLAVILDRDILTEEKIQALLIRKKPRDFYDLYFMLRNGLINQNKRKILVEVRKEVNKTKINFDKELKLFLPKTHHAVIKNFKKILLMEIEKYI